MGRGESVASLRVPFATETPAKLRHSGESRNPEGLGKRGSDYQCVGLKRCRGVLEGSLATGRDLCKTIGVPPVHGGNKRGLLRDDQANNATDKSFAKVSGRGMRLRCGRLFCLCGFLSPGTVLEPLEGVGEEGLFAQAG